MSGHYAVHIKVTQCYMSNYILISWRKRNSGKEELPFFKDDLGIPAWYNIGKLRVNIALLLYLCIISLA